MRWMAMALAFSLLVYGCGGKDEGTPSAEGPEDIAGGDAAPAAARGVVRACR